MNQFDQDIKYRTMTPAQWLTGALLAAFVVAAAITAYLTFVAVRDFVATWELTNLPGIAIADAETTPGAQSPRVNSSIRRCRMPAGHPLRPGMAAAGSPCW